MKKLLIYTMVAALTLVVASPALAQNSQEDQYNGPELTCDNYLEFEVPPPELVEECEAEVLTCDNYYLYEVPPSDLVENCEPPQDLPCSDYHEYELLRPHLPERCEGGTGGGLDAIPEAGNSSNQTFENFSNALSELKSEGANESEAVAVELDEPTEQSNEVPNNKASNKETPKAKDESGKPKEDASKEDAPKKADSNEGNPKDEEKSEAKESLDEITELPETGGAVTLLLGASALLLAGGLTVARLFR